MVFFRMFDSHPELIKVFSAFNGHELSSLKHSALLHEHALRVMATVDSAVIQINDRHALAENLCALGMVHKSYNVPFEQFQVCLVCVCVRSFIRSLVCTLIVCCEKHDSPTMLTCKNRYVRFQK